MKAKSLLLMCVGLVIATSCFSQDLQVITGQNETRSQYENKSYVVTGSLRLTSGFTFAASSGNTFFAKAHPGAAKPGTPNPDRNFSRVETIIKEGIVSETQINTLGLEDKSVAYEYLDGMGRSLQVVSVGASPGMKDIVHISYFDNLGRPTRQYLPYASSASSGAFRVQAFSEQRDFYDNSSDKIADESQPYAKVTFENSPLSTPLQVHNTGSAWANKPATNNFRIYDASTPVKIWDVNGTVPVSSSTYPAGSLTINETINEEGRIRRTYSDFLGKLILSELQADGGSWARTYYVYNDYGNVLFIIPPGASQENSPTSTFANQWYFQYEYDKYQRPTGSKSPGAGWIYTIYDKWDRPVLTQDANQRAKSPAEWSFIKYDAWNRIIATGVYATSTSRQTLTESVVASNARYETVNETSVGYTLNATFPTTVSESNLLTVQYYDNYSFLDNPNWDQEGNSFAFVPEPGFPSSYSTGTLDLSTGSKVRVITGEVMTPSDQLLNTVIYYDDDYRPLQTLSEHHLGGVDRITVDADPFNGQVEKSHHVHKRGSETTKIITSFDYNTNGLLVQVWQKIDSGPEIIQKRFEYNELGQIVRKKLHSEDNGATWQQAVDYRYNIHGALTQTNYTNPEAGDPVDYFAMELAFENALGSGNDTRYDGMVTAMRWKDENDNNQKVYNYSFDAAGQLSSATYKENTGGGWTEALNRYNESVSYDLNGNITNLSRNGQDENTTVNIDNLGYTYSGNQLMQVGDSAPQAFKGYGFVDGNTSGNDYGYDANGNLTFDKNKGISSISYSALNMPARVTFADNASIEYQYDAAGIKLSETYLNPSTQELLKVDYIGKFLYRNNALVQIRTAEGHYATSTGKHYYYLMDHLGSPRVIIQNEPDATAATASFETSQQSNEASFFQRYDNARMVFSPLFDHTNGTSPGYSQRLNGTSNEIYGLARSLSVMPGDTVRLEVFAKYVDPDTTDWSTPLRNLLTQIAAGTASPGSVVDGENYLTSTSSFEFSGYLNTSGSTGTGPKAYLNWLIFDRDFNFLTGGFVRLSNNAREFGQDVAHEKLSAELVIEKAGYVYAYLSNENETPVEVFFDDFKVEQVESHVIQINGYYPYGLPAYVWVREGEEEVKEKFQGKENSDKTGWHDFHARQYDAVLGRWFVVDPQGQFHSPYTGMGNNPVMMVDPDGEFAHLIIGAVIGGVVNWAVNGARFDGKGLAYFGIGAAAGALSAGIGAGVNVAMAGGSFGAGFAGTATGVASTGFLSGAATGAAAGFTNGFVSGTGNSLMAGNSFGNSIGTGLKSGGIQGLVGGVTGGIGGGLDARSKDLNFWNGTAELNLSEGVGAHGIIPDKERIVGKYVGKFEGVNVYETPELGTGYGSGGITLPGRGITVGKGVFSRNLDFELMQHEFGHVLQIRQLGGFSFLKDVGLPSISSANQHGVNGWNHNKFWTEVWANRLSNSYFDANYGFLSQPWNYTRFPLTYRSHSDYLKVLELIRKLYR